MLAQRRRTPLLPSSGRHWGNTPASAYRSIGRSRRTTSATRSRRSGSGRAAWEACLTVTASTWPQAWVQDVRSDIERTRAEKCATSRELELCSK
jgi:hypothetical protein